MVFISFGLAESRAPQRTLLWAALVCRGLCWHSPGEGRGLCSRGPVGLRLLGSLLLQLLWGGAGPGAAQPPALCTRGPVSPCGWWKGSWAGRTAPQSWRVVGAGVLAWNPQDCALWSPPTSPVSSWGHISTNGARSGQAPSRGLPRVTLPSEGLGLRAQLCWEGGAWCSSAGGLRLFSCRSVWADHSALDGRQGPWGPLLSVALLLSCLFWCLWEVSRGSPDELLPGRSQAEKAPRPSGASGAT